MSAGPLLGKSAKLPMGRIELTRVKDANHEEPSQAVIQSVEFHPAGQLLLTAGFDKHLRFFQVSTSVWSTEQGIEDHGKDPFDHPCRDACCKRRHEPQFTAAKYGRVLML